MLVVVGTGDFFFVELKFNLRTSPHCHTVKSRPKHITLCENTKSGGLGETPSDGIVSYEETTLCTLLQVILYSSYDKENRTIIVPYDVQET